jgi:exopolysaccharide biosynthesis polyprenyl glycosylphosphotransferase
MFGPIKAITNRIYTLVNAAVVLLVLLAVFTAINWSHMQGGAGHFLAMRITVKNLIVTALFLLASAMAYRSFGLSKAKPAPPLWKELVQVVKACTVACLFVLLYPLTTNTGAATNEFVLYFLPVSIVACLCGRVVARALTARLAGTLRGSHDVIIVGSGPRAAAVYQQTKQSPRPYTRVLGFVDSPGGHPVPAVIQPRMLGRLNELEGILMKHPVDEVIIALPAKSCYEQIQTAIRTCERAGVEAKYLFDIFQSSISKPRFEPDDHSSVVSMKVVHDDYRLAVKRAIDVLGAFVGLIVFGPLMLAIALAIKLASPGRVIFAQERPGFRKRRFMMYKFRTMVPDAEKLQANLESINEAQGPVFKIRKDPRITPIGRILRKTSLDELPQFFNVLRGDMSLVGPRPLPIRDFLKFDDAALMRRFSVKPGLTCLWQINGRSNTNFDQWIQLDLQYIDTWSLGLDLRILAKTVPSVLAARGAV